jgi:hypothetical protein
VTDNTQKIASLPYNNSELKKDIFNNLNCIQIGKIQEFNSTTQTATIEIQFKRVLRDRFEDYPLLLDCPVVVINGGSGKLTMPIAKGDNCIVLFCDRCIDDWFTSGTKQPPRVYRTHDINDGFALVGINHLQSLITNYLVNGVELSYNGGGIKITTEVNVNLNTNISGVLTATQLKSNNGASGTFTNSVIVVNGIVTGGT